MKRTLLPHTTEDVPFITAVHIIMEKTNAKTQDCFLELIDLDTKAVVMSRYENMLQSGRPPKMGTRHVAVEDSSQGDLMKELFHRAHCIAWDDIYGFPIKTQLTDPYGAGFMGFLTDEELHMVVRYTLDPDRVSRSSYLEGIDADDLQNPYSGKCLQRTFESMMMILGKVNTSSVFAFAMLLF